MTWSEVQSIVANNYYRSGIPDDKRETIIELPSSEYLATITNLREHFTEFRTQVADIGYFNFHSVGIPGLGKVRLEVGNEVKVFHRADIIFLPNIGKPE